MRHDIISEWACTKGVQSARCRSLIYQFRAPRPFKDVGAVEDLLNGRIGFGRHVLLLGGFEDLMPLATT